MTPAAPRVALTGGIATGKSYCLARFAALGARTVDADDLARAAVMPGTAGHAAVRARFGHAIVGPDGAIDRAELGRIVFADPAARRDLEAIIHPQVFEAIRSMASTAEGTMLIAAIPLLFETGHADEFDVVIATVCPPDMQIARLRARGLTDAEARQRLASQMPAGEKARRAHRVIDTSGSFEQTDRQVAQIWRTLPGAITP